MKLILLTQYPIPFGMAQSNRIIAMAKGLAHAGDEVIIECIKPTETLGGVKNEQYKGKLGKVSYCYPGKKTIRSKFVVSRLIDYLFSLFRSLLFIIHENRKKHIDAVIFGYTSSMNTILFCLVCMLLSIKKIHERSEYPFLSFSKSLIGKSRLLFYLNFICKRFDGMIVITHALEKYYKPYLRKNTSIFLLPILVEPERFNIEREENYKRIAYCGSMEGNKDGVPILIDAFHKISDEFPDYSLILIGNTEFSSFSLLKKKIEYMQLDNRIIFIGKVDRLEMPKYLVESDLLVLARPLSKQAEGGFPTKLGEYLATGRPVVVTDVGEITEYLIDNKNAFISKPNSATYFAEKMKLALSNMDNSKVIGTEGQNLALTIFNYQYQGKLLSDWIRKV
jgi:glycosyltransferase involved in cell wall biosynthesis